MSSERALEEECWHLKDLSYEVPHCLIVRVVWEALLQCICLVWTWPAGIHYPCGMSVTGGNNYPFWIFKICQNILPFSLLGLIKAVSVSTSFHLLGGALEYLIHRHFTCLALSLVQPMLSWAFTSNSGKNGVCQQRREHPDLAMEKKELRSGKGRGGMGRQEQCALGAAPTKTQG